MRHLIIFNNKFAPSDTYINKNESHIYVEDSTTAEMYIDYAIDDYVDVYFTNPKTSINDIHTIYAYSPAIPGACVVYIFYTPPPTEDNYLISRLIHVGYVYREDSPFFNLSLLSSNKLHGVLRTREFLEYSNKIKDDLYNLHGKEQYTELPWD